MGVLWYIRRMFASGVRRDERKMRWDSVTGVRVCFDLRAFTWRNKAPLLFQGLWTGYG